ncbi:MAG: hypothetical protein C5B57_07870 [Blastocatellia bacterium]|nr:MAG: hypothetical protein C5B57_07870 [Blastocatellia bacterium]
MVVVAMLVLMPVVVNGQGRSVPRMPWGDPDISGLWTNATLTLLQRPPELAGKEFFTSDEAEKFEQTRVEQTNADRPARAGEVGAYNDVFFERGKRGVKSRRTSLVIEPRDGRIPPFTADAQQRVDARAMEEEVRPADGPESRWLTERCILFGATVPMLPEPYNNNYSIIQTPGYVTILVEMNHDVRIIPLDGRPHLSTKIQQWTGDSRGRWEGDTLVVETTNLKFNDKSRFGVGFLGGLSDQNLRVVERITRVDGNTLNYQAAIEDPTIFTRRWTIEQPMDRTRGPLYEVACHEGNYGMGFILSGHRADERAAGEAAQR